MFRADSDPQVVIVEMSELTAFGRCFPHWEPEDANFELAVGDGE